MALFRHTESFRLSEGKKTSLNLLPNSSVKRIYHREQLSIIRAYAAFVTMTFLRLLFSGVYFTRALAGSELFDDAQLSPDISLHQETFSSEDIKPSTQSLYDETDIVSGYDDDFSNPSDYSLFFTTLPSDVSALATADDFGSSFSSLSDGPDPDLSLFENPGCSLDDNQSINKREKGKMCPSNSANPSTRDQSFERGGPTDPEFYGLPLAGYDAKSLSSDEEKNGCLEDAFGLSKFLVCDSGLNEDRFSFYQRSGLMVPGIALRNCEQSMY